MHGGLLIGGGDSFLEKESEQVPLSQQQYDDVWKVSPEVRAIDRLKNPAEYGISK